MKGQRGVALISALLVVMSVYLMVTVMVANMQAEFATTRLDSRALQQRYAARAACAEMSVRMTEPSFDTSRFSAGTPYEPPGYDPPVKMWITRDPRSENILHLHAQSGNEMSLRVFRRTAAAEAQIFAALVGPNGMRLHSLAMRDALSTRTQIVDEVSPWQPMGSPPGYVYNASGELVSYDGGPDDRYVADLRGGLYSVMSSPEGFAAYSYAGGRAWERLPLRPAVQLNLAGGTLLNTGDSFVPGAGDEPVWEASRDGGHLWFAENLDASPAAPSGASYLQRFDNQSDQWDAIAIPRLALAPGQPERFTVKDIAAGKDGYLYLLTNPTAACPESKVVAYNGSSWSVLPNPPRKYYHNGTLVQQSGTLPVETIAVGPDNTLFASSPAEGSTYAISKIGTTGGWDMGVDRNAQAAQLPSRDFRSAGGFRALSVDAGGKVLLGSAQDGNLSVRRGTKDDPNFTELPSLSALAEPGEQVWSNIGGGVQGTTSNTYKSTAEY